MTDLCQYRDKCERTVAADGRESQCADIQRPRSAILGPGCLYHVGTRGVRRLPIVDDDFDRAAFFRFLADVIDRLEWSCLAFCLMTNHYHLLIRTREPDLPIGMQRLNFLHAYRFNRRHGFEGHLFERRYFAELVKDEAQLVATAQYIELNPVRAGMSSNPETWPWSSCASILGLTDAPSWFDPDELLSLFGNDVAHARVSYALRLHNSAHSRRVPLPGSGTAPV